MKYFFFIFLVLCISQSSCKKNTAPSPPTINLIAPTSNSIHTVFESITVDVIVEDNNQLEYVLFDVINNEGKSVVDQVVRTNLSKKEHLVVLLQIDDIHIKSGNYFVRIVASDGTTTHREFVSIIIQEIPLKLEKTFLFNAQNSSMDSLSSQGEIHTIHQFENTPVISKANDYTQDILVGFNNPSRLISINNNSINQITDIAILEEQTSNFYNQIIDDPTSHHFYVSTKIGKIIEIGTQGTILKTFNITPNRQANCIVVTDNLIIVEEKNFNDSPNTLNTYFKNSGILVQNHFLNLNVLFMKTINENEIILIGNENQQGTIIKYLINENTLIYLAENLNQITTATQINSYTYAISSESEINLFEINPTSINTLQSWTINATALTYHRVNNQIIGLNQNNYFTINPSNNQMTTIAIQNYSLIELLYNK